MRPTTFYDFVLVASLLKHAGHDVHADDWYAVGMDDLYEGEPIAPLTMVEMLRATSQNVYTYASEPTTVPDVVAHRARLGFLTLAWMDPDRGHHCHWWADLHICEGGALRVGFRHPLRDGAAVCRDVGLGMTGHYVCTDIHLPGFAAGEVLAKGPCHN